MEGHGKEEFGQEVDIIGQLIRMEKSGEKTD
jgi:hypothetical protein